MLLLRLWNYIRGYVIIIVEGNFLEKFINICIHRQIFLWDIKRQKNSRMSLKISIKGFRLLRPIVKKTGCSVRIKSKRGLPFFLNRYKKRKTFLFGAFIFIILIYILSSFVWVVEVSGNKKLDSQVILQKLASFGVKPGELKFGINTNKIIRDMMLDTKELAWVGITVKGTKVKVKVLERVKPPDIIPKDFPCNIMAYRDGVIFSIIAKAGQQVVKTGDTVTKGQLLISGTITSENKEIPPKQVHAMGNVFARTWYEKISPVQTTLQEKVRTEKVKSKYSLGLFTKIIKLFHGKDALENYDKVEIKKNISIGEDLVLPFEIIIDKYYEEKIVKKEISLEEAKKLASETAYKEAASEIPEDGKIVNSTVTFLTGENGALKADVVIECTEDIGYADSMGGK